MKVFAGAQGATAVWFSGLGRRPLRLLLTVIGIASGVALLFAVTAQNASLTSGTASIYSGFAGRSKLELVALGPEGMPLAVAERVRSLPGVAAAAPVSEESVTIRNGDRSVDVRLFGVDGEIRLVGGTLAAVPADMSFREAISLYVSPRVASDLGVDGEAGVEAFTRIGPRPTTITRILPTRQLGGLARIPVAFATLPFAELLTDGEDRIQRLLVVPRGHPRRLSQALQRVGGPGTVVWSTATEVRAADQSSALSRSSSSLFAALSLVVGGVLAYGTMALTMAERRREVAVLRALGCGLGALLFAVFADALLLGGIGTVLGIVAGRLAAAWLLPTDDSLLSSAFLLGNRLVVPSSVFLLAGAAGLGTAMLAVALPARALTRVAPGEALRTESNSTLMGVTGPTRLLLALGAAFGTAGVLLTEFGYGLMGVPLWVLAGLFAVPTAVSSVARILLRLLPSPGGAARIGISEIAAFPGRAVATTAIVTLAVSGLLVVNGAVANIETGTGRLAAASYPSRDLFVTADNRSQVFFIQPLAASFGARLSSLSFISYMRPWRAAFLDWDERSVLAYAFTDDARSVRADEFLSDDARSSARALADDRSAVAVSSELASIHHLHVGSRFDLPTPAGPQSVRVAAIITDFGWLPGAVALNPFSYAAWWGSRNVTAYQIGLSPGISTSQADRRVQAALAGTGFITVSSSRMRARVNASARSQLADLRRTGQLIALAGLVAVLATAVAGVLGRIRRVSALRTIGMSLRDIVTALACETSCVIGTGVLLGGLVGVVGQALAVNYLSRQFALNVVFALSPSQFVSGATLSVATVVITTLVASRWAARVPLGTSLREL